MGRNQPTPQTSTYDPVSTGQNLAAAIPPAVSRRSLQQAVQQVLGRNEVVLPPGTPGAGFHTPIKLDEVLVNAYQDPRLQEEQYRLEDTGVTAERLSAFGLGPSRYLTGVAHDRIRPMSYPTRGAEIQALAQRGEYGAALNVLLKDVGRVHPGTGEQSAQADISSEDAWSLYLGLPQKNKTFEVSPFRPSNSSDTSQVYYRRSNLLNALIHSRFGYTSHPDEKRKSIRHLLDYLGEHNDEVILNTDFVLGDFAHRWVTVGRGEDDNGPFISMYDIYDLDVPVEREGKGIGRPFEIYDRVYYDPETFEPIVRRR